EFQKFRSFAFPLARELAGLGGLVPWLARKQATLSIPQEESLSIRRVSRSQPSFTPKLVKPELSLRFASQPFLAQAQLWCGRLGSTAGRALHHKLALLGLSSKPLLPQDRHGDGVPVASLAVMVLPQDAF